MPRPVRHRQLSQRRLGRQLRRRGKPDLGAGRPLSRRRGVPWFADDGGRARAHAAGLDMLAARGTVVLTVRNALKNCPPRYVLKAAKV